MMVWRHLMLCLGLLQLPLQADDTFCYDIPGVINELQPKVVAGQHIYGEDTVRVAGWLAQQIPNATFLHLPWQRCLSQVREGRIDGLFWIGWTAERAQWFQFPLRDGQPDPSLALEELPYHIYVHKDSKLQWDGQRFAGLQYGMLTSKGYLVEQRLRELNALSPLDLDISHAVDLVVNHRIDGYVIAPGITEQQFQQHPEFAKIRRLEPPLLNLPLYFAFSKKFCQDNAARCQQLWRHLAQRRQEFEATMPPAQPQ